MILKTHDYWLLVQRAFQSLTTKQTSYHLCFLSLFTDKKVQDKTYNRGERVQQFWMIFNPFPDLDYIGLFWARSISGFLRLSQPFLAYLYLHILGNICLSLAIFVYLYLSVAIYIKYNVSGESKLLLFETFWLFYHFSHERFLEELALLKIIKGLNTACKEVGGVPGNLL